MRLSPNFHLDEFTRSQTATRRGWSNNPPPDVLDNIKRLAATLEQVRVAVAWPITITSGYRSPQLNEAIGGARNSQHTRGLAADIVVTGLSPYEVCQRIMRANIAYDQLISEFGGWTHISIPALGQAPRNHELTYKHGRPPLKGIVA